MALQSESFRSQRNAGHRVPTRIPLRSNTELPSLTYKEEVRGWQQKLYEIRTWQTNSGRPRKAGKLWWKLTFLVIRVSGVIELEDPDEMAMAPEAAQEYAGPSYTAGEVLEMFRQELARGE